METFLQDLRYGARSLVRQPAFSLVAIVVIALGIGANTAIFSVVNTVLLRPLPYPNPDELVMVWETAPKFSNPYNDVAPANFIDWREQNNVFAEIAAFTGQSVSLTGRGEPERLEGQRVSASLFPLLGVAPALGRAFTEQEDQYDDQRVIVLSHGLWQRRFGGDSDIIGQTLTLNFRPCVVVGVMPPEFQFPGRDQEFWLPMSFGPEEAAGRGDHYLNSVARLKPGVTRQQAQSEMNVIASQLELQYPKTNTEVGVVLIPLHEQFVGGMRKPLFILLGVVGFVLLIGCANVTNLLLVRATARHRELTIRAALGASQLRLARMLLTESLLLAVVGGAAGVLLATWGIDFLETLVPQSLAQVYGIPIDGRVLAFSAVVSLLTGVVFGLMPAVQVSKPNLSEALKEGGRGSGSSENRGRVRAALVIGEIALSLVLLAGAGLMIRSFSSLTSVDPGFKTENRLTMRMLLSGERYADPIKRRAFYDQMLERVQSLPGVESAGVITQLPLTIQGMNFIFSLEGQPPMTSASLPAAAFRVVSNDYFRAIGIPLLRGRSFTSQDTADTQAVVVINRTMAERFWPDQEVIGKRFKIGPSDGSNPWLVVAGVVGDVRQNQLDQELKPEMYVSYNQDRRGFAIPRDLVVLTAGEPLNMAAAVRSEIWKMDKDLPLFKVQTMEQILALSVSARRFNMLLLSVFAALALILASIGVYGVMSYATAQRTHEIGIRIALGAEDRDVLRLVVRQGMILAFVGTALGILAALAVTRVLSSFLYAVTPSDPLTFVVASSLLLAVALGACFIPARRATKVDPMVALRYE